MSLYIEAALLDLSAEEEPAPLRVGDEHVGFNGRLAAWITETVGSMWTVYACSAFFAIWMLLAQTGPLSFDRYPFPFLLFLGNVVQLLLIFVILLGQQVLGAAGDKRALATYHNAEAILREFDQIQNHLNAQDEHMERSGILCAAEQTPLAAASEQLQQPPRIGDEYVGVNGRLAAFVTRKTGTMTAFYIASLIQFGWMVMAQAGVLSFDGYPFPFLLFLSSLTQLLFMFVIMVGQQVIGKAADKRALQTYLDADVIRQSCQRIRTHLAAQDLAIRMLVDPNDCTAD